MRVEPEELADAIQRPTVGRELDVHRRRAALLAAESGHGPLRVGRPELDRALAELRRSTDDLTSVLLGARRPAPG
jgi:hypothetical protein